LAFHARAQLYRPLGCDQAVVAVFRADLAHERQVLRVRGQRLADQFVARADPVELRGVDVVDPVGDGAPQHGQSRLPVEGRAGQLHGAEPDPRDAPPGERGGSTRRGW
jgi:hypothetical protein